MNIEDCYQAGYIGKPHGVKGLVKAVFDVDKLDDYIERDSTFLQTPSGFKKYTLEQFSIVNGQQVLLGFEEVTNREDAEAIKGAGIFFPLDELPELTGNKFYYHEIVGYTIVDDKLGELGKVVRVDEMPAQDLIIMRHEGREIPIPITDEFVIGPDRKAKTLQCNLPEGLLEI